jgi:hypothetical protein
MSHHRERTHVDGSKSLVHMGGWRRQHLDDRDKLFQLRASPLVALPPKLDLLAVCSPVEDQGDEGSCTAHGVGGTVELNEHALWNGARKGHGQSAARRAHEEQAHPRLEALSVLGHA